MKLSTLSILASAAVLTASTFATAQFASPYNLAVFAAVPQTGTTPLNNSTNINILELGFNTAAQAAPIQTINASGGATPLFTSGSATSTGYLTLSNDRSLLSFSGHQTAGSAAANVNTIAARGVGTISTSSVYTRATTYTNDPTSGQQARAAATVNNTDFQIADQRGLFTNGSGTAPGLSINPRGIKPFGGTFYVGQQSSTTTVIQVSSVGGTLTAPSVTGLTGLANSSTINDFYLVQSTGAGIFDTLYTSTSTGISKFSLSGGTWTSRGTASVGGLYGISARAIAGGTGFEIYATTGGGGATNSVVRYVDSAAFNSNIATGTVTTLFTAPAGTVLKGIDFVPGSPVLGLAQTPTLVRTITWQGPASAGWNTTATNLAWNTSTGSGSLATSYNEVTSPSLAGDNVIFGATGAGSVAVQAAGVSPTSVSITEGTYTFTGGSINSLGNIDKAGNGPLTFANVSNTAAGNFNVLAGSVQISAAEQMPVRSSFSNGTTLRPLASFTGAAAQALKIGVADQSTVTVEIAAGQTNTFGGFGNASIGVNSKVNKTGAGDLVLALAPGGGTTTDFFQISAGRLVLNAPTASAIPTLNLGAQNPNEYNGDIVLANYARVNFTGGTFSGTGSILINRSGDAITGLQGSQISLATSGSGVQANVALNIIAQPASGEPALLRINFGSTAGNTLTFSGSLSGPFDLNFSVGRTGGAGLVVLSNTSTYTGNSFINSAAGAIFRNGIANPLPATSRLVFGETNTASGTWDLNGYDLAVATLETGGGASATNGGAVTNLSATPATLLLSNPSFDTAAFRGRIGTDSAQVINIVKSGNYTQELNGTLAQQGSISVTGGKLLLGATFTPAAANGSLNAQGDSTLELSGPRGTEYTRIAEVSSVAATGNANLVLTSTFGANRPAVLVTNTLTIANTGAFVDITNNDIIVQSGDAAALRDAARTWLNLSSSGGSDLAGLGSTTADKVNTTVAVFNNNANGNPFYATYDGVALTASSVIIHYTYVGDTNIDGILDGADLINIIEGLSNGYTGWENGDVNHDGVVNIDDFNAFNFAFSNYTSPLGNGQGGPVSTGGTVPEPAALGLLLAGLPLVSRRRR